MHRPHALLLLGPTASGKTPLGERLAACGLDGRVCYHLDFGAALRAVAAGERDGFTPAEMDVVRQVLATGALLEEDTVYLAAKILDTFLVTHRPAPSALTVLNGLPRHVGQAAEVAARLHVIAVCVLECAPTTVRARLRRNTGGDRGHRTDDGDALVARKLEIFRRRTTPLVDWFTQRGARVFRVPVTSACTATATATQLAQAWRNT